MIFFNRKYILENIIFLIFIFLSLSGCKKDPGTASNQNPNDTTKVDSRNTDWIGLPNPIHIGQVDENVTGLTFGIISDTHADGSWCGWCPWGGGYPYRDTERVLNNRKACDIVNQYAGASSACFLMHLGDLGDANNAQNFVAFRQIWEFDYPGIDGGAIAGTSDDNYNAYSQGHRINLPVFLTQGNHDSPQYSSGETNWHNAIDYISNRMIHATGLASSYGSTAYAFRWGRFFLVNLGLWAGSGDFQNNIDINYDKLNWLKNLLATHVGESNMGVIIFQHYGWNDSPSWWTQEMMHLEEDILCRRENHNDPGRPYNILGIFTGHDHQRYNVKVNAGVDEQGNTIVFDNYYMNTTGVGSDYGFSIVYLTANQLEILSFSIPRNQLILNTTKAIHVW